MKNGQFPEIIKLADLNGKNGFLLNGEDPGDQCGYSVSALGDFNKDGYNDLAIGAWLHWTGTGRTYVVYGGPNIGNMNPLPLALLNGTNGLKIDGEGANQGSGMAVAAVGDVNGDGYMDLITGAGYALDNAGRSYVVFGGTSVGSNGILPLSSLNGVNGFMLDGEAHGDGSGELVDSAGDINGDGYADILIGAYGHNAYAGRTYVVFGSDQVGKLNPLKLGLLNGVNGFIMDGEAPGDASGKPVRKAGDINQDGYADFMIGADGHAAAGRGYLIFGNKNIGNSGLIALSGLNGTNGFKIDGCGGEVDGAGNITGNLFSEILVGSCAVFGDKNIGSSGLIDLTNLNGSNGFKLGGAGWWGKAGDVNGDQMDDVAACGADCYVVFGAQNLGNSGTVRVSDLNGQNGFKLESEVNSPISSITVVADINGDQIDDLLIGAYSYNSNTGRGYVIFGDIPPVLVNNSLSLSSGEAVVLNSAHLGAYDRNHDNATLVFIPSNITHGEFELINNPDVVLNNFTQQQIWDQQIQFVHDGSEDAPTYNITVRSDGIAWTGPILANINFSNFLKLENNKLVINQGQAIVFSSDNLKATYYDEAESDLIFLISNLTHGRFEFLSAPNQSISIFQQQNITDGVMRFVHDNSPTAPGYRVAVSNGTFTTSPQLAWIDFDAEPILVRNALTIRPGQTIPLTIGNLYATTYNGIADPNLMFIIRDVQNGFFSTNSSGNQIASQENITFSQQQVKGGEVIFSQQGSGLSTPAYQVVVTDGRVKTSPTLARVILSQGQFPEILQLADLNGQNGFKIDGENKGDQSGISVSTAGDINGDGHTDLLIGAFAYPGGGNRGRSYVVFGEPKVGSIGDVALSSLNGSNGFKIDGENDYDYSGYSISSAGDINSDRYVDIVIGAGGYNGFQGRSYVVFGGEGKNGDIALSSLNGANGFKIDGENGGDDSGCSVSAAGDINGDGHDDLIIGAVAYPPQWKGRSYVVFGGPGVGSSGSIALSSLNGVNGFKLDGENNNDNSGNSVSAAGDLNGDGYADLIVGASNYQNGKGRSYIVFGGLEVGGSGVISLSSLTGTNGFKLDGENPGDVSGYPVSSAGDINGDGYSDLIIGAMQYPGGVNKGCSYVVFGRSEIGSGGLISLSSLNGVTGFRLNNTLIFIPIDITHGQFESINNPGVVLNNFTQQQIWDNQIQFVHNGSSEAPAYNITVRSSGVAWTGPISANITFNNLILETNQLIINQGQTVILTLNNLKANNQGKIDQNLNFLISDLTHGQFEFISNLNQSILIFQQQNITDGIVQFVHDNSANAPGYRVSVSNGTLTTPAQSALIDFDASPILLNNSLIINQGQTVSLASAFLSATHPGGDDRVLLFNISSVMHGKFSLAAFPNNPIFSFYQQNITDRLIQFGHDNSTQPPNYLVSVSDGRITLKPSAANIDFDVSPILEVNQLIINQGQTIILTDNNLRAIQLGSVENSLEFIISAIQQGQFSWTTSPEQSITRFVQQNITDRHVQFTHNNSTTAPAFKVAVSDGRITTLPSDSQIDFDTTPLLVHNQLTIGEGQSITFTSENLLATHNGAPESNLTFQVTNIQNGGFILLFDHEQQLNGDVSFQQQQVTNGQISFTSQNSAVPAYRVSVTDGRMSTNPQYSNITFFWKPILTHNQFLSNRGQVTVLTTDNIAATRNGTLAKDLQFVVAGTVQHGRFEQRSNPGNAIISFYQQDILQQIIQFAHDNSTGAPQYSLKVLDNQSGLSSDAQTGKTVVVLNNYFPVNQGENLLINGSILNATGIQSQNDGNIVFTPITGTVQHGHFALASFPDYPLTSFQQHQISAHEILFVPDNSATAPSGYLTVSDGQTNGAQGTMACNIDFDVPPVLKKAYLKTSLGEQIKITDINLKATSQTSTANNLIFEISEISHGYFADNDDWQTPLNNFTQQRITDGNMIFITDQSGQSPQFKVSVWDSRLHCVGCPQQADVVFQGENTSGSSLSDAIKNTVITAAVSGIIGLLFFALRYKHSLSLQRNARPTIDGEEKETYPDTLLLPIAREIFSRIKITGCLGYIGKRDYNEYIGAVSMIVAALETKEVIQPNQWNSLPRPRKQRIIDAIAMHTKELVGNNRCCSARTFTSFYRAEATPKMIRDQAETIADAVQETLSNRTEAKGSRSRSSVRLTLTSAASSLNESQMKTPLLK